MKNYQKLCEIEIFQVNRANEVRETLKNTGFLKLVCNLNSERFKYEIWIKNPINPYFLLGVKNGQI